MSTVISASLDWLPMLAATAKDEPSPWAILTIPLVMLVVIGVPVFAYRRVQRLRQDRMRALNGRDGFQWVIPDTQSRNLVSRKIGEATGNLLLVKILGGFLRRITDAGQTYICEIEMHRVVTRRTPTLVGHATKVVYDADGLSGSAVVLFWEDEQLPRFTCRLRPSRIGDIMRITGLVIPTHPEFSPVYAIDTLEAERVKPLMTHEVCALLLREPRFDLRAGDGMLMFYTHDSGMSPAAMLDCARRLEALSAILRPRAAAMANG